MARKIGQTRKFTSLDALYEAYAEWLGVPVESINGRTPASALTPSPSPEIKPEPEAAEVEEQEPSPVKPEPLKPPSPRGVSAEQIMQSTILPPSLKKSLLSALDGEDAKKSDVKPEPPARKVLAVDMNFGYFRHHIARIGVTKLSLLSLRPDNGLTGRYVRTG